MASDSFYLDKFGGVQKKLFKYELFLNGHPMP